jgi:glycosyltransferase involved in cell wall biosynthesis
VFRVLYFGQYIPLHGVEVIIEAARLLDGDRIEFHLVGKGQMYAAAVQRAQGLSNVVFHHTWLPPADLIAQHIAPADVCLGVFDPGPKAGRVIPQKVYAALAAGKPIITGDSPAIRELLTHAVNALLVPRGAPEALARAIWRLRDDPALRWQLAARGRRLFKRSFHPEALGTEMESLLHTVVSQRSVIPENRNYPDYHCEEPLRSPNVGIARPRMGPETVDAFKGK